VNDLKTKVDRARSEYKHWKRKVREEKELHETAKRDAERTEEAQTIVQAVAATIQEQAHRQIASVVSRCLEAVFDDPYRFVIGFEKKRGKTEAVLTFERDGLKADPMTASGGGVVDVAAFALRLACLVLSAPQRRKLLVLDEPFRFASRDLRPKIRGMLETLAEEMGIQFVIVTHDPALVAGKVVEL
jgi:ABC-type glutathione transport system ATPase component